MGRIAEMMTAATETADNAGKLPPDSLPPGVFSVVRELQNALIDAQSGHNDSPVDPEDALDILRIAREKYTEVVMELPPGEQLEIAKATGDLGRQVTSIINALDYAITYDTNW